MPLPPWFIKSGRTAASKTEPCRQRNHQDVFRIVCVWSGRRARVTFLYLSTLSFEKDIHLPRFIFHFRVSLLTLAKKRRDSRALRKQCVLFHEVNFEPVSSVPRVTCQGTCVQICVLQESFGLDGIGGNSRHRVRSTARTYSPSYLHVLEYPPFLESHDTVH